MGSAMTPATPDIERRSAPPTTPSPRDLVDKLGSHPATLLGLRFTSAEVGDEAKLERWLLASCLFGGRVSREQALLSLKGLDAAGLCALSGVRAAGAGPLAQVLADAGHPRAEATAGVMARLASKLAERGAGALDAMGRAAADLEELGGRLSALATGFGAARIARFLQPLRDVWPAASELPLDPNACRAAVHLGWLGEDDDAPSSLRSALDAEGEATSLADLESALAELGRRACRRDLPDRCPLSDACPRRKASGDPHS